MTDNGNVSPDVQAVDQKQIIELLQAIINVQERHTVMLKQMLDAATRPLDEKSPVAIALEELVTSTTAQTAAFTVLNDTMNGLPERIGTTMKAQISDALNTV